MKRAGRHDHHQLMVIIVDEVVLPKVRIDGHDELGAVLSHAVSPLVSGASTEAGQRHHVKKLYQTPIEAV